MKIKLKEATQKKLAALMSTRRQIDAVISAIVETAATEAGMEGKITLDPATMEVTDEPQQEKGQANGNPAS